MINDPSKSLIPLIRVLETLLAKKEMYYEDISYCFDGAYHFMSTFLWCCNNLKENFDNKNETELFSITIGNVRLLSNMYSRRMSYNIDSYFSFVRRCQDRVMGLLKRQYPELSLPDSMNAFVKKKGKYKLSKEFSDLIEGYWSASGSKIRDYRVHSEHNFISSTDTRVVKNELGEISLYMLLPSNPENKSSVKAKYRNKTTVHALEYMLSSFKTFTNFLNNLSPFFLKGGLNQNCYSESDLKNSLIKYQESSEIILPYKGYKIPIGGDIELPVVSIPDKLFFEKYLIDIHPEGECGLGEIVINFQKPQKLFNRN